MGRQRCGGQGHRQSAATLSPSDLVSDCWVNCLLLSRYLGSLAKSRLESMKSPAKAWALERLRVNGGVVIWTEVDAAENEIIQ